MELGARTKGVKIGPNQSTNAITCALNDFTSSEDHLKPFVAFTTFFERL